MNMSHRGCNVLMLLFGALAWVPLAPAQPASSSTYPQIVRVSFVQGDVRVSRGKAGEKASGAAWQKAVADLPLEEGFSLVTGAGRAEIEFEDTSVVYMAENSVLEFNELSSTGGVPHTELALLSGMVSLDLKPMLGEWFGVSTPTDRFTARWYPDETFVRINSYLDGMTLTAQGTTVFHLDRTAAFQANGNTIASFRSGQRVFPDKPADPNQFAEWDQWVLRRLTTRHDALAATMKEAGLSQPIPGLAAMNDTGKFFPCPPYGTCWEPTGGWTGTDAEVQAGPEQKQQVAKPAEAVASRAENKDTISVEALQAAPGKYQALPQQNGPMLNVNARSASGVGLYDDYFPCSPWWERTFLRRDPVTGLMRLMPASYMFNPYPYRWAVCHAGSWIHLNRRYVWVVGIKRHHHPVHWVKEGRAVGFVPIHPRDVAGKPPVNLKYGIFHPTDKKGDGIEHVAHHEGQPLKLLDEPPKEFRKEYFAPLARAEEPHAVAYRLNDRIEDRVARGENRVVRGKEDNVRVAGTPVTFDHKSQSFMVARSVVQGGNSKMVSEPIGGRGSSLQTHAGGGSNSSMRAGGGSSEMSRGSSSSASVSRGSSSGSYSGASSGGGAGMSRPSAPAAASAPASVSSSAPSSASSGKR